MRAQSSGARSAGSRAAWRGWGRGKAGAGGLAGGVEGTSGFTTEVEHRAWRPALRYNRFHHFRDGPMRLFETLGHYHDHFSYVILSAPDGFPEQDWDRPGMTQRERFDELFGQLLAGSALAEKQLKDARRVGVFRELLKMAHEAYEAGDRKLGAHTLQEAEGLVWPSRAGRPKHAVEAERRAFGELLLYRDVVVSPYPFEGSEADLGEVQRRLWRHAAAEVERLRRDPEPLVKTWAMTRDRTFMVPAGRSKKAMRQAIRDGAADGSLIGCVRAELLPGGGLLCIDVEEAGRPRVSIRALTQEDGSAKPRFHLEDPELFAGAG